MCGSQPNLQREAVARMLADWDRESPGRVDSIFTALRNVEPSHLADPGAFDFAGLERRPPEEGA
ncbi:tRNA 2-thiocytidine biosynthesis protein TtcA [compost metagenome]